MWLNAGLFGGAAIQAAIVVFGSGSRQVSREELTLVDRAHSYFSWGIKDLAFEPYLQPKHALLATVVSLAILVAVAVLTKGRRGVVFPSVALAMSSMI